MFYLGIDFGTSGARAIVIDEDQTMQAQLDYPFSRANDQSQEWHDALFALLQEIPIALREEIQKIAINGTSSTVLLCDQTGAPLTEPLLYSYRTPDEILKKVQDIAPANHVVQSASSSFAKLLFWQQKPIFSQAHYFLHQADWLAFLLHGKLGISDYHNALKLGYDVENFCYPRWLKQLPSFSILPQVFSPGSPIARLKSAIASGKSHSDIAQQFHFPSHCQICTGTTDSIAAFIASGANQLGEAVTSLGSTLALKLLSATPVQATEYGIYSHRFGNLWLTGGASNTGGQVLKQFFSDEQLKELSAQIDPTQPTNLDYYPLLEAGERFPINDPNLPPKLSPQPDDEIKFLQGLLESIARIEAQGYQKLQKLGASPFKKVYTAGGGAKNEVWQTIREQYLQVPVAPSPKTDAAYGSAILAQCGFNS